MSISDVLMWRYYELLSSRSLSEIAGLREECARGRNPRDIKRAFAIEMVTRFHDSAAADAAAERFEARFRHGALPEDIPESTVVGAPIALPALLRAAGLCTSASDAVRNIEQGGVRVDGGRITDRTAVFAAGTYVVQVGKRRIARITLQ